MSLNFGLIRAKELSLGRDPPGPALEDALVPPAPALQQGGRKIEAWLIIRYPD